MKNHTVTISVVVPVYNEVSGLGEFHQSLMSVLEATNKTFEVIYVDDGSNDKTPQAVQALAKHDPQIKLVAFSRNFGKESALSAGIATAGGEAILMLDGDGQHPVELIPDFIKSWRNGSRVVVGVRTNAVRRNPFKRLGSRLFYAVFNRATSQKLVPGSTDFRLIDSQVQQEFLKLHESDRMTRGLIDWLGFEQAQIPFKAKPRLAGTASYSSRQLVGLALDSILSLTMAPLYIFGYLGVLITVLSFTLGSAVFVEQLILEDPLHWNFTGTAMLAIMLLFLVGLVLMSQGILSLYIAHIQNESRRRPLYVIDHQHSVGIDSND